MLIPRGIDAECRRAFNNPRTALVAVGATPADVQHVTAYLLDPADRAVLNQVFSDFFPAASCDAVVCRQTANVRQTDEQ